MRENRHSGRWGYLLKIGGQVNVHLAIEYWDHKSSITTQFLGHWQPGSYPTEDKTFFT